MILHLADITYSNFAPSSTKCSGYNNVSKGTHRYICLLKSELGSDAKFVHTEKLSNEYYSSIWIDPGSMEG